MATVKEQEQLIEVLRFTPRTYRISMWGYGGEKVMGTVDRKVWDYCMDHQVDLNDIAWNYDVEEEMGLDPEMLPFPPGSWYECDDMAHVNGVSRNAGTVQVDDENGETVFQKSLEDCDGGFADSPTWCCNDEVWIGERAEGEVVFIGSSNEKGTFFEGDINLKAPFNIELLELHYDEIDGEEIVNSVYYDGEEIENYGGSTDGKSSDFNMVLITDSDGHWERYEPGEKDWGHPEFGVSPSSWENSPKFTFKKHKPVYPGYYTVNWGYGSTFGSLYWDGENFGDWEFGKFNTVDQKGVKTWSGYNWDTSDWVNQPPKPPDVKCSNKKCGWIGDGKDRIEDEDYNDHCPECNGTEFDWIDYDPDTKEGLANREKYCKPWDPAVALERIKVPEDDEENDELLSFDDEPPQPDYECVQCGWKGTVDEAGYDDDDNIICPECGEPIELIEYNVKINNNPWIDVSTPPGTPGTYEVKNTHTPVWPFPAWFEAEWTGAAWVDSESKEVPNIIEWRELNV